MIQYLDTNWVYPSGSPTWKPFSAAAGEGWFEHSAGGARVQSAGYGGGYLANQANPAVRSFFAGYARSNYAAADGLMMDDQSPSLSQQLYYSTCHCTSTSELTGSGALRSAHEQMSAAMTRSDGKPFVQIDNTLPPNPYLPQGLDMLNQSAGVQGLVAEGEPFSDGTFDPYYSTLLDQIAYVADNTNGFVVPLSYAKAGAAYQQQARRVQEATMLLGYSPGHLVDWADLEQGSANLAVWPEEGLYPTGPVQSMSSPAGPGCLAGNGQTCTTGGHNDLQVAPGIYRREFTACYDKGAPIGPCATIINTTPATTTIKPNWLTHTYPHQITLNGGDIQTGGTITTTTPTTNTIPAHNATLLAG